MRRVIIKTVQSDNVTKTDVIKLNSNNNSQTGSTTVKKADGELFGVPVPVNGKHSGANEDVKKNSIVKILEGSNTKVLTAQEGKSLLSLGKTTSAKVREKISFSSGIRYCSYKNSTSSSVFEISLKVSSPNHI